MGIGDWGLGIGPNPQSPIPNPQLFILYLITLLIDNNITIEINNYFFCKSYLYIYLILLNYY